MLEELPEFLISHVHHLIMCYSRGEANSFVKTMNTKFDIIHLVFSIKAPEVRIHREKKPKNSSLQNAPNKESLNNVEKKKTEVPGELRLVVVEEHRL